MKMYSIIGSLIISAGLLAGCASSLPSPSTTPYIGDTELTGKVLFDKTFTTHGGSTIDNFNDLNVKITGEWKYLIRKIQPIVTDYEFRVDSEERLLLKEKVYSALYQGPGGSKKVVRTPDDIAIFYNGIPSTNPERLSAAALTADAFYFFLLGPLALESWRDEFIRIADARKNGKVYHRIYLLRRPGFGFSEQDEIVLWIDSKTFKTTKVQITLEGHETTQGAHVEVEYLAFKLLDTFLLPVDFYERVNAPIAIDAHAWHYENIDINRGLMLESL